MGLLVDPATGRSRAERAFGKDAPKKGVNTKKAPASKKRLNKSNTKRVNKLGMFDGPRPSYGKYNVSEQASDILNRSINKKGTK
jgi:hypothetical protein